MKTVEEQLIEFISQASKESYQTPNAWLEDATMQVYVRRSRRLIDDKIVFALDIANVGVYKPGQGRFTQFLDFVKQVNPWSIIYVESVLNNRFWQHLLKKGFIPNSTPKCCYLKM